MTQNFLPNAFNYFIQSCFSEGYYFYLDKGVYLPIIDLFSQMPHSKE